MSDTMTQGDPADAGLGPSIPAPTLPGLDVAGIDQKLRHIDTIQSTWGLPPLPDETKLDLASQYNVDHKTIGDFLWGIASDINKKLNPLSADQAAAATDYTSQPGLTSGLDNDPNSLHNRIRRTFSDLTGNPPATVLDMSSPQSIKQRAVEAGLLPATTDTTSDLWDPSLNGVAQQLTNQQFQDRVSGDKTGSLSVNTVVNFLGDLVTPSALAKESVGLGVIPDVKRAVADQQQRGGFLSQWVHDPMSPSKFLRAVSAVAGSAPILGAGLAFPTRAAADLISGGPKSAIAGVHQEFNAQANVILPVVNDMLLASGVGEVIGIARAAFGGAEAVDLADRGLYAVRGAEAFQRAQEPSLLSRGLGRVGFDAGADALAKWRQLSGVAATRAAVGALGQRAIAGTVEGKLFPELNLYEGSPANLLGADIHSAPDMQHFKTFGAGNPFVAIADVALAPPGYFAPGTFSQVGQRTAALVHGLTQVSQEARTTTEVARGVSQIVSDPAVQAALRSSDPYTALVNHFGSPEVAGAFSSWATSVAAIDKDAVRVADNAVRQEDDPAKWKSIYLKVRDGHVAKLVQIDPGDVDSFLNRLAPKVTQGKASAAVTEWSNRLLSSDPAVSTPTRDLMNQLIDDHNAKRQGVLTDLISNLGKGDVANHITRFFANDENFTNFIDATDMAGRIPDLGVTPQYTPAFSPAGRVVGNTGDDIDPVRTVTQHLYDIVRHDPDAVKNSYFAPLSAPIQPGQGRFAVARLGTPTKQNALELLSSYDTMNHQLSTLKWLDGNQRAQQAFTDAITGLGKAPSQVGRGEFLDAVQQAFASQATPGVVSAPLADKGRSAVNTVRRLDSIGGYDFTGDMKSAVTQARQDVQGKLAQLAQHPDWSSAYGIADNLDLEGKIKQLRSLHQYIAAEVSGLPDEFTQRLASLGYKVVHGGEFVMPNDVTNLVRPFSEVSRSEMAKMSLDNFITPVKNQFAGRAVTHQLHGLLSTRLADAGMLDASSLRSQLERGEQGLPGQIIHALWDHVRTTQDTVDAAEQAATTPFEKLLAHAQSSVVPLGLRDLSTNSVGRALAASGDATVRGLAGNDRALNLVRSSILKSYDLGSEFNGLSTLEDKLRSQNVLTDALKVFSKTDSAGILSRARLGRAAVGAGIGGALGAGTALASGGDPIKQGLQGAAAGAGFGALGADAGRIGSRALLGGVVGGVAGGMAGGHFTGGFEAGALAGAGTAAPGVDQAVSKVFDGAEHAVAGSKWYRYANLPDALANLRNKVRFTINPIFDMRRYVKSNMLTQMADLPEGATIPLNNSLKSLAKDFGPGSVEEAQSLWNSATQGEYGVLNDTDRFFAQKGILGYSPKEMMAATNYRLIKQGVDPEEAANITQKIFAYSQGRSPLEKSINFVFFPFSFEKKVTTASAKFLLDDTSRAVVLHDALQAYNMLNQRYDLSQEWRDHLPVLEDLQKMNAFQHGLGPGELGGINAPILNLFLPHLLHLDNQGSSQSLQHTIQRLVPVYNDVDRMLSDMASQGHVMFSASHATSQAEADRGYSAWNAFKDQVDTVAKERGFRDGYNSVMRNPQLESFKTFVHAYKAQLDNKYPGFAAAQNKALGNRISNEEEINQITADPQNQAQAELAQFHGYEQAVVGQVRQELGVDLTTSPELVPPEVYRQIRAAAIILADRGHGFDGLYKKYYQHSYGPISRQY